MPHDRFHDYFDKLGVRELQEYMENLMTALKRVHEFGVIHRDVKPSNFLHDRKNHKFLLVDFGLAQALDKECDSTKSIKSMCKETPSDKSNNKPNEENTQCDKISEQQLAPPSQSQHATLMDYATEQRIDTEMEMETEIEQKIADGCAKTPAQISNDMPSYKSKRKISESDETENKCSNIDANPSKRLRTLNDQHSIANGCGNENTSQHPRGPYIPSSHFKTPLKQMNEISLQKQFKRGSIEFQSPLSADIKSTVLSYSIGSKIDNQRTRINSLSPALAKTKSPVQLVSAKTAFTKSITASERSLNTPTPPDRKYNLDNRSSGRNIKCFCYGRPTVCNVCLVKKEIQATRAGTPGYRPTEVLLKYVNQTTAVDCWAAGTFHPFDFILKMHNFYFLIKILINFNLFFCQFHSHFP